MTLPGQTISQLNFGFSSLYGVLASIFLSLLLLSACGGSSGSDSVNNNPSANAGVDQVVTGLATVQLQGGGSDPDPGTALSYQWAQSSGTTVSLSSTNIARPTFTAPDVATTEILVFRLTVSDGSLSASDTVQVTVEPAVTNQAPVANAGDDQTVVKLTAVQLQGSGTDPDAGAVLSYAWQQTSGTAVSLSDPNVAQPTFTSPDVAPGVTDALVFELTVSDGDLSDTDSVQINVVEQATSVVISGKVQFEFVPANTNCSGLNFAGIEIRPIRKATVQLLDSATSAVLDSMVSDDLGNYSFTTDVNRTVRIRVRAELKKTGSPSWDVEVRDNTASTNLALAQRPLYVLDSSAFSSGGSNSTRDLTATTGWGGSSYTGARAAAPFAVLDTLYNGIRLVLTAAPTAQFGALDAFWSVNNSSTSTTTGGEDTGELGTSYYRSSINSLFLLGKENDDTEEFDDHVIAHEWGHYFEDNFSRSDSIGGSHGLGDKLDARLAFGEGWATALSGMILNNPTYCDVFGTRQGTGFRIPIESNTGGGTAGWFNEFSILSLVYDLWDTVNDGVDSGSVGFGPIFDVMTGSQRVTPAFTSIFTFAEALKVASPANDALIDNILEGQGIVGPGIDRFGSTETNDVSGAADVFPIYTDITPDGTVLEVCTNSQFDTGRNGNKLSEHRYLKFTLPRQANYNFQVTNNNPSSTPPVGFDCTTAADTDPDTHAHSDPDFFVYKNGVFWHFGNSCEPNSEQAARVLGAGDYVMSVVDFRHQDEQSPVAYPERSCFDISITPQ